MSASATNCTDPGAFAAAAARAAKRSAVLSNLADVIIENLPDFYRWEPRSVVGPGFLFEPPTDGCKRAWNGHEARA